MHFLEESISICNYYDISYTSEEKMLAKICALAGLAVASAFERLRTIGFEMGAAQLELVATASEGVVLALVVLGVVLASAQDRWWGG